MTKKFLDSGKISKGLNLKGTGLGVCSNQVEAKGGSKLDNDMPTFKIELAGNPNSCVMKINKSFTQGYITP